VLNCSAYVCPFSALVKRGTFENTFGSLRIVSQSKSLFLIRIRNLKYLSSAVCMKISLTHHGVDSESSD
jgi:hypothetical protein